MLATIILPARTYIHAAYTQRLPKMLPGKKTLRARQPRPAPRLDRRAGATAAEEAVKVLRSRGNFFLPFFAGGQRKRVIAMGWVGGVSRAKHEDMYGELSAR